LGKKKLQHFAETKTFENFIEPSYAEYIDGFSLRGNWNKKVFKNDNPIILELGCGKGEYTVGLGEKHPEKNYIGVDVKGARMWKGCKTSVENNMTNIAFLRIQFRLSSALITSSL